MSFIIALQHNVNNVVLADYQTFSTIKSANEVSISLRDNEQDFRLSVCVTILAMRRLEWFKRHFAHVCFLANNIV